MNEKMQAYRDAWAVKTPESREQARLIAEEYIAEHPEEFALLEPHANSDDLEKLVKLVDMYRAAGLEEEVVRAEMFLLARFEPQHIGGRVKARMRFPGGRN